MKRKILSALKVTALAIVLSFGLSYVYAWTTPTATPPGGNVAAPINTSGTAQSKTGNFTAGNLTAISTSTANRAVVAPKYCIGANCITAWPTAVDTTAFLDKSGTGQTKVGNLTLGGLTLPSGAGLDKVLSSDAVGNATWQTSTAGNIDFSVAGVVAGLVSVSLVWNTYTLPVVPGPGVKGAIFNLYATCGDFRIYFRTMGGKYLGEYLSRAEVGRIGGHGTTIIIPVDASGRFQQQGYGSCSTTLTMLAYIY